VGEVHRLRRCPNQLAGRPRRQRSAAQLTGKASVFRIFQGTERQPAGLTDFVDLQTSAGSLTAVVTTNGASSGAAVQVATFTPVVTSSTANLAANATSIVISGYGLSTTAGNNTVVFNDGAAGSVTTASATSLTLTFSTMPTTTSSLTAGGQHCVGSAFTAVTGQAGCSR
jgi:hypothetical protein